MGTSDHIEPASPDEIDQIIHELLAEGPEPLLVANNYGETHVAGSRLPSVSGGWGRYAAKANNADEVAKAEEVRRDLLDRAYRDHPGHGDREAVEAVLARRRWAQSYAEKLAGDVFHGELERMDLRAAINKSLKDWKTTEIKQRANEAIRKAVHGDRDQGTTDPSGAGTE